MAAVGGSIIEITYNHPTVGQGFLFPKSDADSTYDLGGIRTEDNPAVDGRGAAIYSQMVKGWSFETEISSDMNSNQELEKLSALSASPVDADFTITHINGTVYSCKGRPVGDVQGKGKDATINLKLAGGGVMKQI
jgi:hypothetical protein